ncbi:reverse transcriptase [Plakobranchus ocellatus]|uniref:Reverse transcriptase n=1 Tax=Plakobranchus ocellatus TaxID=259542 RepID=A0AAV3YS58_9GAST|nr:reverse transcriptase [Plakobranchus ocellatus]
MAAEGVYITKEQDSKGINQFRPISLLNVEGKEVLTSAIVLSLQNQPAKEIFDLEFVLPDKLQTEREKYKIDHVGARLPSQSSIGDGYTVNSTNTDDIKERKEKW